MLSGGVVASPVLVFTKPMMWQREKQKW